MDHDLIFLGVSAQESRPCAPIQAVSDLSGAGWISVAATFAGGVPAFSGETAPAPPAANWQTISAASQRRSRAALTQPSERTGSDSCCPEHP